MARCFGTDVASSTHNNGRPTDIFSPFIFIWFFQFLSIAGIEIITRSEILSPSSTLTLSRHYPVRNLTAESLCFCSRRCAERETETGSSACLVECVTFRCFRRHHLFFSLTKRKEKQFDSSFVECQIGEETIHFERFSSILLPSGSHPTRLEYLQTDQLATTTRGKWEKREDHAVLYPLLTVSWISFSFSFILLRWPLSRPPPPVCKRFEFQLPRRRPPTTPIVYDPTQLVHNTASVKRIEFWWSLVISFPSVDDIVGRDFRHPHRTDFHPLKNEMFMRRTDGRTEGIVV